MTDNSLVPVERIEHAILVIRGHRVIVDKDLAVLYEVTTGNLNKAVTRNLERFPDDFMFTLSEDEMKHLFFQFGTSSWGGTRSSPTSSPRSRKNTTVSSRPCSTPSASSWSRRVGLRSALGLARGSRRMSNLSLSEARMKSVGR